MCGNIMMKKALQYTPDRQSLKTDAGVEGMDYKIVIETERKY